MTQAQDHQTPQVPVSWRKRQWLTIVTVGLLALASVLVLVSDGVSTLVHNLGNLDMSRVLAAPEEPGEDDLYWQANALFRKALGWNPDNVYAYRGLGRVYLVLDNKQAARQALEQVVTLAPHDRYANYQLGFLYDELGWEDAAVRAWQQAGDPRALIREGLSCRGQSRDDCAERFFKLATSIQPDLADAYYHLGVLYMAQGRDAEAIVAYTRALDGPSLQAKKRHLTQAYLHSYAEQWEDAIAAYQRAIEEDPDDADAYIRIGTLLLNRLNDQNGAIGWYQAAVEADPRNVNSYLRLAAVYWMEQDCAQAAPWYQRAADIAKQPEALARAQMGLSRCARLQGNLERALQAAQAAVDAQPTTAPYHVLLADIYADLERNDLAIASYETALALDPENKRARRRLEALRKQE